MGNSLIGTREIAALVGWSSTKTAERYCRAGRIRCFLIGGEYKARPADVERFIQSKTYTPPEYQRPRQEVSRDESLRILEQVLANR